MHFLVIVAHPDDELLGCGGALARWVGLGYSAHALILSDGVMSRGAGPSKQEEVGRRKTSARRAAQALGMSEPQFGAFPDQRFDSVDLLDITRTIEKAVHDLTPDVVLTHHSNDLNNDHCITHRAVLTACRPLPDSDVSLLLTFETLSSTEWGSPQQGAGFRPSLFVDISATLDTKITGLDCYAEEMRPFPHPRSEEAVRALAKLRGSQAGLAAAEGFEVVWARAKAGQRTGLSSL